MPGLGKIGQIVVEITASNSKLKAGLAEASSAIRDWSLVTTGLTAGITNAFKTLASVGIKGVAIALATLTGAFALVAKSGADFEDNILRAFVLMRESSGATARDLESLTAKAIEMGSETLFSATEAAEGLQVLARAGFSVGEALRGIAPIVDLAIVGNLGMKQSADVAISSMYGFGLAAEDMSRVADVLAIGAAQANTTVGLLGSSLSFVAPVARAAGLSIEETTAAIDILSNAGIRGSRAGTTLRRALSVLLAPTGRAKKVFKELGLTFVDSEGKLESFTKVLQKLESANLTAAQTMEIFGLRAGPGMAALLAQGSSAFEKMTDRLEGAEGAANRMSQEFRTTVKGRMRDLGASVVNLGLAFSEKFKKPLADTIFSIRNYIKEITEAWQKSKVFKAIVEGVINALSPLTNKIIEIANNFKEMLLNLTPGDVTSFFDGLKEKVQSFMDILSGSAFKRNIISLFEGSKATIMAFLNSLKVIGMAFTLLPETLQPLVAAIAGLGGTFVFLMGGIGNIITLFIVLGAILKFTTVRLMATNIGLALTGQAMVTSVGSAGLLKTALYGLSSAFKVLWASVLAPVLSFAAILVSVLAIGYAVFKLVQYTIGWDKVIQMSKDSWNAVKNALVGVWEAVTGIGISFVGWLKSFPMIVKILAWIGEKLAWIGKFVGKTGEVFKEAFNLDEFKSDMDGVRAFFDNKFTGIFDGAADKLKTDVSGLKFDPVTLELIKSGEKEIGKSSIYDPSTFSGFVKGHKNIRRRKIYGGDEPDKQVMTSIGKMLPFWEANMRGILIKVKEIGKETGKLKENPDWRGGSGGGSWVPDIPDWRGGSGGGSWGPPVGGADANLSFNERVNSGKDNNLVRELGIGITGKDNNLADMLGLPPLGKISDSEESSKSPLESFNEKMSELKETISTTDESKEIMKGVLEEVVTFAKELVDTRNKINADNTNALTNFKNDIKGIRGERNTKQGADDVKTTSKLGNGMNNITDVGCH